MCCTSVPAGFWLASSTYTTTSATSWMEMHLTAYVYGWMRMLDVEKSNLSKSCTVIVFFPPRRVYLSNQANETTLDFCPHHKRLYIYRFCQNAIKQPDYLKPTNKWSNNWQRSLLKWPQEVPWRLGVLEKERNKGKGSSVFTQDRLRLNQFLQREKVCADSSYCQQT